jgi:hypothetical protein
MPDKWSKDCVPLMELDLSEEQRAAIKEKVRIFRETMMNLRVRIMEKRLEFSRMLKDLASTEEDCREKGREIETLKAETERTVIDFSLVLRRILTPDQIEKWCPRPQRPFRRESERRP